MRDLLRQNPGRRLVELLTLNGFAVAAPFLDAAGDSPEFFVHRAATRAQVAALLVLVVLALPLVLWLVELAVAQVDRRAASGLHLAFAAVLVAAFAVQAGKELELVDGAPLAGLALAAGAGFALLMTRYRPVREFLVLASPVSVVFVVLFVSAPSGALLRGGDPSRDVPRGAVANRPPIVFVLLDEFPLRALLDDRGRIDARLFPNFARLARRATWFRNGTGVNGFTPYAAPAILAGRYPTRGVAPSYTEHPETLYSLVGATYRLRAYETITQLCPPRLCSADTPGRRTGFGALVRDSVRVTREIVSPDDDVSDPRTQFVEETVEAAREEGRRAKRPTDVFFRAAEVDKNQPARFTAFLAGLRPSPRPTLHFLHLLLPHATWRYLPSGRTYPLPPGGFMPRPTGDPAIGRLDRHPGLSQVGRARLLLQVGYTDRLVGELLDRLEATRLLDESLLIVGADHGVGLEPGARDRKLDARNAPDLAWVPMFLSLPGQRQGGIDDRNAQMVDVLPTISDVLGVRPPWRMDGVSLRGPRRRTATKTWVDKPGRPLRLSSARWLPKVKLGIAPEVTRAVARGREGLVAVGPLAGLVSRRVEDLPAGPALRRPAVLDPSLDLERVDPASLTVPALLWGTFPRGRPGGADWLAVAVNGTVAGVATTFQREGESRFVGVAHEARLRRGRNRVALYVVERGRLRRIPWARG